jgi:hypothetical protein
MIKTEREKMQQIKKFLWCSPHQPTEEQLVLLGKFGAGYELLEMVDYDLFYQISNLRACSDLSFLAHDLIQYAEKYRLVQPGGSPAFQYALGRSMSVAPKSYSILYSFSERVSEDIHNEDGSVTKTSVFKHVRWLKVK